MQQPYFGAYGGEGDICELYAFPNSAYNSRFMSLHFCFFLPWTFDNRCCQKWTEGGTFPQTTLRPSYSDTELATYTVVLNRLGM